MVGANAPHANPGYRWRGGILHAPMRGFARFRRRFLSRLTGNRQEPGFALLIVVVVLVALSLLIGVVVLATRNYTNEAIGRHTALELRAALDGATATVVNNLLQPMQKVSFDTPQFIRIGDTVVVTTVRPELAKVDLNSADPALIRELLRASGLGESKSRRIADEIADWRGLPGPSHPSQISTADYAAAGRHYHPPHQPFETISDLALLLDGDGDLVACLAPEVTLYSHSSDVDLSTASDRVIKAMAQLVPPTASHAHLMPESIIGGQASRADLYEVIVSARDETSGISVSRQIVLRLTGDAHNPMAILADVSPAPNKDDTKLACDRLAKRPDQDGR